MDNLYLLLQEENLIAEIELMETREFEISENSIIENNEGEFENE